LRKNPSDLFDVSGEDLNLTVAGLNLLQPYHHEFAGDNGNVVGIPRSLYTGIIWIRDQGAESDVLRLLRALCNLRQRHRPARVACAGVLLVAICFGSSARAQRHLTPSDLEAVYLYNFGKFVSWPSLPDPVSAPFSICTLGKDDFDETLSSLTAHEAMQGHKIIARHLSSAAAANGCQILYLGASEQVRLARDLEAIKEKPILTVSIIPDFLQRGGMIQFVIQDSKVRFAVNLSSATECHLALSSELLKVAISVNGKPAAVSQ
jgi:hypothetical protein